MGPVLPLAAQLGRAQLGQWGAISDSVSRSRLTRLLDLPRLEKNANQLQKEAKAYLDAVRSVSASSTRIGQTLDLFFGSDSGEQAMAANAYKRAVEELEGSTATTIVSRARI